VSPFEESVLMKGLETARAWGMLYDPKVSGELTSEDLLELCRRAGINEEDAQKMAKRRANERMDRELEP